MRRRRRSRSLRAILAAIALVVACVVALAPRTARAEWIPELRFYTIETKHFRVTYHSGVEQVAQQVASTAESIYGDMTSALGFEPKEDKTDILLVDSTETANGSASVLPYNAIRLLVTAPEDMSPLGDVDDWYVELVTHEFTHILHLDNISGLPVLVNDVLGKSLAPNQLQPRWILEGYGVYQESARTSGGRLRNTQWDMFMRADVLQNNVATIDEMSNIVRRWPQGNLFYLYGSYFVQWIAETYGEGAFREVSRDYGGQLIPGGIQRSIRRATGKTYDELYPAWVDSMRRAYGAQAATVRAAGIREGRRITHHGQVARYPRWIPKGAWAEHEGGLLYYRDDQHTRPGLYALDVVRDPTGSVVRSDEKNADLVAKTAGESYASFLPDGGVLFSSTAIYKNVFAYGDVERIDPGKRSRFGTPDGGRHVVTPPELRAGDPAVSPDGRRIVFVRNGGGTRTIHIGDLDADGKLASSRLLVPTAFAEQAFTPRWSPDGTHVVYTVWKHGGYRDIRYVDVRDGSFTDLTNDRAFDGGPSFSRDGRYVYFHSDRTGISNLYAYELATGRLRQVTNVLTGAFAPEASPDDQTLAYVGYGAGGFDLYAVAVDESQWTDAAPYVDDHPTPPEIVPRRWDVKKYSPWHTIVPRRYGVQITPGNFGEAIIVSADGADLTGLHTVSAQTTVEVDKPELQGAVSYTYGGLPFDYSVSLARSIAPRGGFQLGTYAPTVVQESVGYSSTLSYTVPTAYDTQSFAISQSVQRIGIDFPIPIDKLDPAETPVYPARGLLTTLHLSWSYTNAERFLWSVGAEKGYSLGLAFDFTDPTIGSDYEGFAANGDFTTYLLMPWLRHHSLALHAGGGTSGGSFPGHGAFFVGGFADLPLVDTIRNQAFQGGFVLRGYQPGSLSGRSYVLGNAEYRFPIVNIDRGDSTLPLFLNRITGAAYVDYGSGFDVIDQAQFKTGVGGEVWFDTTLGYVASFTFRLGYARGLASTGLDKLYFVAAVPF